MSKHVHFSRYLVVFLFSIYLIVFSSDVICPPSPIHLLSSDKLWVHLTFFSLDITKFHSLADYFYWMFQWLCSHKEEATFLSFMSARNLIDPWCRMSSFSTAQPSVSRLYSCAIKNPKCVWKVLKIYKFIGTICGPKKDLNSLCKVYHTQNSINLLLRVPRTKESQPWGLQLPTVPIRVNHTSLYNY